MTTQNYRQRIYEHYAANFQDANPVFDVNASIRWGAARKRHLRNWLPENKDARIVDLACGGGKLLHFLLQLGYTRVEGVDLSSDQISIARQVTPNVTQDDVIAFLEARTNQFDLITGYDIVEHFHKDELFRFLDALFNALKPGGRVILQTPNAESPWGAQHRYNDLTHEVAFNPNSLKRLLSLVGLTETVARECDPVPVGHTLTSTIRALLWQLLRLKLKLFNLVETGNVGDGIFTRVFLVSAVRQR